MVDLARERAELVERINRYVVRVHGGVFFIPCGAKERTKQGGKIYVSPIFSCQDSPCLLRQFAGEAGLITCSTHFIQTGKPLCVDFWKGIDKIGRKR